MELRKRENQRKRERDQRSEDSKRFRRVRPFVPYWISRFRVLSRFRSSLPERRISRFRVLSRFRSSLLETRFEEKAMRLTEMVRCGG
jgi:hypothetical protein